MLAYAELTKLLLREFPELEPRYREEFGDWEEEEHGPHVVYADLLVPFLADAAASGDEATIRRVCRVIESFLTDGDELTQELADVTLCEAIVDRRELYVAVRGYLAPLTRLVTNRIATGWGLEVSQAEAEAENESEDG